MPRQPGVNATPVVAIVLWTCLALSCQIRQFHACSTFVESVVDMLSFAKRAGYSGRVPRAGGGCGGGS